MAGKAAGGPPWATTVSPPVPLVLRSQGSFPPQEPVTVTVTVTVAWEGQGGLYREETGQNAEPQSLQFVQKAESPMQEGPL